MLKMKKTIMLFAFVVMSAVVFAQNNEPMSFAGPSRFGVEATEAWQDNENDVIVFCMNSTSDGDITMPALTFNSMGLTIPSFTIHSAKFDFDYSTRVATFNEQTFDEVVNADGVEKSIKGYSLSGKYTPSTKTFDLKLVMSYGKMPVKVTYTISSVYDASTAVNSLNAKSDNGNMYNIYGVRISSPKNGEVYISGGKKIIKRK